MTFQDASAAKESAAAPAATAWSATELGALRTRLMRHARMVLADPGVAEDLVQDTLLGVLEGAAQRRGDASLVTWATSILKHKIADWYRAPARRLMVQMGPDDDELAAEIDADFDERGHWSRPVPAWQQPEQHEERRQMMGVLEDCMGRLPSQTGRVFFMREWLGFDNSEIGLKLGLSGENVRQILHRARMGLRGCMQHNWVGGGGRA